MFLAIKDKYGLYYCGAGNHGAGLWDKQLRKAKIYSSWKKAVAIRDDGRFNERESFIVSVAVVEQGPYNPDWDT